LNAKRITASDGFGRHGAKHGQSARRQHGQNCITHESLPIDSLKQPKPSAWVPVNSRSWVFDAAARFECDRLEAMVIVVGYWKQKGPQLSGPFAKAGTADRGWNVPPVSGWVMPRISGLMS
jgi:hypothetical protein